MKIVVTRKIPEECLTSLYTTDNEVWVSDVDRPLTAEELLEHGRGADVLLTLLTDHIDGEVMDAVGPQLKLVSNYAVGFDNVNIPAATSRNILVANTPSDEVNEAVAEHTWALILSLTRRVVEADEATKRGAYNGWEPDIFLGPSLSGKTLGIVGLGRIGSMVARRAAGFDMNILYTKHSPDPEAKEEWRFTTFDDLLAQSDIVTLHVPLTNDTRHMMSQLTMAKMKPRSYLVNTARGQVVDEHDLVAALRSGHLAGAALDVFDNEPDINPELVGMANVVLTPHIASATHEARKRMGDMAVSAIFDLKSGKQPSNLVNPEVWPIRRQ